MRILKSFVAAVAACAMIGGAYADERAEIADLQARIATLEAATMAPAAGGDCESLTSKGKTGMIKIGGEVKIDVVVSHRDDVDTSSDSVDQTVFGSGGAILDFKIDAGCDTFAYIKLDIDDLEDGASSGDLLEELNFTWQNIRGSNWTLVLGKDEMPFGQDACSLYLDGFVHGVSSLMIDGNGGNAEGSNNTNVQEANAIMAAWQGELDNTYGLTAIYKFGMGSFETAVFQNATGMHEDRSDDTLLLQSYAMRVKLQPIEGLELEASFINRHNDSHEDDVNEPTTVSGIFGSGAAAAAITSALSNAGIASSGLTTDTEDDMQAVSFGAIYTTADEKLSLYGEYIHTWNANFYDDLSSNVVSIGASYAITPKITLGVEGDWAGMENEILGDYTGGGFDEDIYRASIGAKYTCDNGLYFILQYAHEWYQSDLEGWEDGQGDLVAFQTGFEF